MKTSRGRSSTWHTNKKYPQDEENDNNIFGRKIHTKARWLLGIWLDCFLDPGANVGVVSSRFRLLYTRRKTSSVPQSRMLGGPQGQSERADGNEPLWVSLMWSKSDYRKPVTLFTIFICIRNRKRRLWKCHLFPPCLLTPSLTDRKWCFSYFRFTYNGYTSCHFLHPPRGLPFLIDLSTIATSRTYHRSATQQAVSCGNSDIRHVVFRSFLQYLQKNAETQPQIRH